MNDDFEKRLQQLPPREIPSAWREEILAAARSASASCHAPRTTHHGLLSTLISQLSTLLRPQRAAWASLATVWVVILALNLATRDDSPGVQASRAAAVVSPETLQVLQQQRLLLAELVGRPEIHPMTRPKSPPPGPRSQRREESATA